MTYNRSDKVDIPQIILAAILLAVYYLIEIGSHALRFIVDYWIVLIFAAAMIVAVLIGTWRPTSRNSK